MALSPNFITTTFTATSPRGRSQTQIMKVRDTNGDKSWNHEVSVKVADTNHESRRQKQSRQTMSQSWRNGIWALSPTVTTFELSCVVGVNWP